MPLIFLFQLIRVINLIISAILLYKTGQIIFQKKRLTDGIKFVDESNKNEKAKNV